MTNIEPTKPIDIKNNEYDRKTPRYLFQAYRCVAGFCHLNSTLKIPEDRIIHNELCFQRPKTLSGTTPDVNSHV